ncbi:hypothetical protein OIU78_002679 [Salix suchowensis]|nr:hypothetical protein OIU78_002679 [Salix suchowensis]
MLEKRKKKSPLNQEIKPQLTHST